MEALPRSSSVIVEAIPHSLRTSGHSCMAVADHPSPPWKCSPKSTTSHPSCQGVSSCLTYLDFSSIGAQRNAPLHHSHCCSTFSSEEFIHVRDNSFMRTARALGRLPRTLTTRREPKKRQEQAARNCFPRVIRNLQRHNNTFVTVLHVLGLMSSSSHGSTVGLSLLRHKIEERFNPQELFEITSLISELMPPLPSDGICWDALLSRPGAYVRDPVLWQWQDDRGFAH
ncbi:E3 ubiquitin-protein ligase TRIP12, partial [Caligus rogercresseyi]